MLICAAGDTHGGLDRLYREVLALESSLAVHFDWVLHVGDLGVWPDPTRIDRATRNHEGAGDFPAWWAEKRRAPRPTVFVKGNHEDFVWLDSQPQPEVLPALFFLKNGTTFSLVAGDDRVTVGGLGGCYGPSDYERSSTKLQGYAKRHYTHDEVDVLAEARGIDVLLVHDAPKGVTFERHRRGAGYVSEVVGLDTVIERAQPQVCLFGHHHTRMESSVAGVPCLGLNRVPMPGCLVAGELSGPRRQWRFLADWPVRAP